MKSFCREFGEHQKMEDRFPKPRFAELRATRTFRFASSVSFKKPFTIPQSTVGHDTSRCDCGELREQIDLTVRDSGVGFEGEAAKESQGLGLISMQERVKLVNGKLSIESQPKSRYHDPR